MDSRFDKMTDEQICRSIRQGQTAGMDYLLGKYKGLVKKLARQFYLIGGESDDLIQEGMIGLMKAIRDYTVERCVAGISLLLRGSALSVRLFLP